MEHMSYLAWFEYLLTCDKTQLSESLIRSNRHSYGAWQAIEAMLSQDEKPLSHYQGEYENPKQPQ